MNKVTVKVTELLEKVKRNRETHVSTFEKAQVEFRKRAIEEFDRRLKDAKQGNKIDLHVRIPEPERHDADYDRAIKMLEMSVDEEVELTQQEFATYVMDDWGWQHNFTANTLSYTNR